MKSTQNEDTREVILIVESFQEHAQFLTTLLTEHGYLVQRATSGAMLLETIAQGFNPVSTMPDMVLLGTCLPDIPGYEVCQRLKADEQTCTIPVIFISGPDESINKEQLFAAGGADYLTSPFCRFEVLARVQTHLELRHLKGVHRQPDTDRLHQSLQEESERRKRAEEALHQSEEQLRVFFEQAPVGIGVSRDGIALMANPAYVRMFGYDDPSEIVGEPITRYIAPGERHAIAEYATRHLRGEVAATHFEITGMRKDGSLFPVLCDVDRIVLMDGLLGLVGFFTDISSHKRTEEALRKSELRYRTVISNASVVLFTTDPDGVVTLSEGKGLEALGLRPGQLVGVSIFAAYQAMPGLLDALRQTLAGDITTVVIPFAERILEVQMSPMYAADGTLIGVLGLSIDITERQQAEIRQSTQLTVTRILMDSATIDEALSGVLQTMCQELNWHIGAVWQMDADNQALHCTHLRHRTELADSSLVQSIATRSYASGSGLVGRVWEQTVPIWLADPARDAEFGPQEGVAETRIKSVFAFPVGVGAECRGVMCFYSQVAYAQDPNLSEMMADIGHQVNQFLLRKHAESALVAERASLARRIGERTAELSLANAELERAVQSRDEFLANMSHELRTPLNAVMALSEALQEEVYGPLTEKQRQSLQTIEESGHHLLSLINDILDLAKIGAGTIELDMQCVSTVELCAACLRLIQPAAYQKHLKVFEHVDTRIPTLRADQRRLKQILVNLLSNAVKFTLPGGQVGLEVTADTEQESVHFTVWDTGIGIAPENMQQLFQPFVQVDSSLSRQHEGTGLGLVLVSRLTEMHGGSVSVESELGKGSRFTVSLPRGAGAEALQPTEHPAALLFASPRNPSSALIVEDSTVAASQITRYLQELDIQSVVTTHGMDAVEQAAIQRPDIIILDILLPDASGWEVLQALKTDPRTLYIPVVVVSIVDDQAKARRLGAVGQLVKPVSRSQVHAALQSIFAKEQSPNELRFPVVEQLATPAERHLVVLADDNEMTIAFLSDYLEQKGYGVSVARNGLEAIARASEEHPDIILMDIQMPKMDGLEAIRRVRANPELAHIPIIALTALVMPGDRERCLDAGATDYISKPVRLQGLMQVMQAHLEHARPGSIPREMPQSPGTLMQRGEGSRGRILIVDAMPGNLHFLATMLIQHGYAVSTVGTGQGALEYIYSHSPDLILLDIALPDISGHEVCQRLKVDEETCDLPVIFISASTETLDKVNAFVSGGVDYITRPFQFEEVLVRVQNQLALQRTREALREREAIYRAMFEKNHAVKLLIHPDTGDIIDANAAACAFYGYSPEQLRSMRITDINIMPPRELQAEMQQAKAERRLHFHFRHRLASGEVRDVEVYTGPIEFRDRTLLYSIIHDITDRVQAEAALQQAHTALEERVAERTAELLAANRALQDEIEERECVEAALRESEERYRRLTENAQDLIYRLQLYPTRRFEYVSSAAIRIIGYTPEDHYADPDLGFKLVHPDDLHLLRTIAQGNGSLQDPITLRWIHKDRTIVWVEQRNVPIFDEAGRLVAIEGIARDVTGHIQAEAELRRQKTLLECQSEASLDGILVVGPDGQILSFNQRFIGMWHIPAEVMTTHRRGAALEAVVDQLRDSEQFTEKIHYLYEHHTETSHDEIALKDGRIFDRYSVPIASAEGEYYGRVWFYRDITQMRRAEKALRDSYTLLQTVLSSLNEAVFVVDPFTRLIQDCNRTTELIFGYTREELIGQETDFLHVNAETFQHFGRAAMQAYEASGFFATEYHMRRKSGELFPTEHFVKPIYDEAGNLASVISVMRDITERKRVEEDLKRRNHQLAVLNVVTEAVNRSLALSDILATLKHLFVEQMQIVAGAIYLYHEEDDHLALATAWGVPPAMEDALHRFPVTTAHNQRVVWEQLPIFFPELPTWAPLLRGVLHHNRIDSCSYLSTPLMSQDEVQGVVDLFGLSSTTANTDQVPFFVMLGQQVGSAIQKARLFEQVMTGRERLQMLSRRLVEVQEIERRSIARELHDEVGQILTGLSLLLEMIVRLPEEHIASRLDQARDMVNDLMQRVREMSLQLRPPMLDDLGLLAALLWHFERYRAQTGIQVIFKHAGIERRFTPDIEIAVYRMIQEALTNVARYAAVDNVVVRLWAQHATLGVQIEDQGRGFDPEAALAKHTSSGLSGMRERLLLLGGELSIESAPDQGCHLSVELPLQ